MSRNRLRSRNTTPSASRTPSSSRPDEDPKEEAEATKTRSFIPPGLHSKFNRSGLDFLKSSFLQNIHEILDSGVPDGDRQLSSNLRFSWNDLNCSPLEERDPVLEIVKDVGIKCSIFIDNFTINGTWGYDYKKGFFRWSDSGTFALALKEMRIDVVMSIGVTDEKELRLWIRPGDADVEAKDLDIHMKSKGIMSQGIINVALPHIRSMWKKPKELSRKIEESANLNLKEMVRLLPLSYPLPAPILGTNFFVGNQFQDDFWISENWCIWQLSSVIVPATHRPRPEASKPGRFKKKPAPAEPELHPFSPDNFDIPRPEVVNLAHHALFAGTDFHISYSLSEFTLNTLMSWIWTMHLGDAQIQDWEALPTYLQRYILLICRKKPLALHVATVLTSRPEIRICPQGIELELHNRVVIAAKCCEEEEEEEKLIDDRGGQQDEKKRSEKEDFEQWTLYHETEHEVRTAMVAKADKDFMLTFSFNRPTLTSSFLKLESKNCGLKAEISMKMAKAAMLEIVENMIRAELLPQLYMIGDIGFPLSINQGCLFNDPLVTLNDHVIIVSGFLEIKEFAKNKRGSQEEEGAAGGREPSLLAKAMRGPNSGNGNGNGRT